ncbi:MAG: CoA transferase, partial [Chloroflexi bacterium]|nr:CoA transferase [Chloroflexota bacterium]
WCINQQGPVVGLMLGDMGAEIIKIEQREVGDPGRAVRRTHGIREPELPGGRRWYFETFNRNKKSIAIDLSKPRGKEIIYRLVAKSDVFVENFRKGVATRLGMDYETLSRHNPRLVYGAATGWGAEGPDATKPGYDPTAQARSGFMLNIGETNTPPLFGPGGMADQLGGSFLAYGILAALFYRERTGLGQQVDSSLFSGMIWLQQSDIGFNILSRGGSRRWGAREKASNALQNPYRCADDKWICLTMGQSDRYWHDFCKALQLGALENDPKFCDSERRHEHAEEMVAILDRVFATKTRAEWLDILKANGDFVYAPVNTLSDLMDDIQVAQNQYLTDLDHPVLGRMKVVSSPVSMSRTSVRPRCGAPECGQHTEEVLIGIGGYTWDDISQLKDEEVI